jgi:DNA-binding transcriptional MocR family regulator
MARRRKKYSGPRFIQFYDWELGCPAYRHLSVYGRALLIEFRIAYNGYNNGEIVMSVRQGAKLIGCNKDTAAKAIKELEEKGWIRLMEKGRFDQKTNKTASLWRITNQPIGMGVDTPETKEYMSWRPPEKIKTRSHETGPAVPGDGTVGRETGPTR